VLRDKALIQPILRNVSRVVRVCPLKEDHVRARPASALLAKHLRRRDLVIAMMSIVRAIRAKLVLRGCTVWVQDRSVQVHSACLAQRRGRVLLIPQKTALCVELVSSRLVAPALVLVRAVLQGLRLPQVLRILRRIAQHVHQASSREEELLNAPPRSVLVGWRLVLEHQLQTNSVWRVVRVCPLKEDHVRARPASALLAKHLRRRDLVIAMMSIVRAGRARRVPLASHPPVALASAEEQSRHHRLLRHHRPQSLARPLGQRQSLVHPLGQRQ
jgi:hypothetical protein